MHLFTKEFPKDWIQSYQTFSEISTYKETIITKNIQIIELLMDVITK